MRWQGETMTYFFFQSDESCLKCKQGSYTDDKRTLKVVIESKRTSFVEG